MTGADGGLRAKSPCEASAKPISHPRVPVHRRIIVVEAARPDRAPTRLDAGGQPKGPSPSGLSLVAIYHYSASCGVVARGHRDGPCRWLREHCLWQSVRSATLSAIGWGSMSLQRDMHAPAIRFLSWSVYDLHRVESVKRLAARRADFGHDSAHGSRADLAGVAGSFSRGLALVPTQAGTQQLSRDS